MQTCFIIMQYIVSFSTLSDCRRTSPNNRNALDSGTVEPVTNRLLTAVTNSSRDPRHRDNSGNHHLPSGLSKRSKVLTKSGLLQFQRLTINHAVVVGGSVVVIWKSWKNGGLRRLLLRRSRFPLDKSPDVSSKLMSRSILPLNAVLVGTYLPHSIAR